MVDSPAKLEKTEEVRFSDIETDTDEYTDTDHLNTEYEDTETETDIEGNITQKLTEREIFEEFKRKVTNSSGGSRTTATASSDSINQELNWIQKLLHKIRVLTILSLIFLVLGICLGVFLKNHFSKCFWVPRRIMYVRFPGKIFHNILSCLGLPVRVTCIIAAIGSMDLKTCRFIGLKAFIYIVCTAVIAAAVATTVTMRMGNHLTRIYKHCTDDICLPKEEICPNWNDYHRNSKERCELQIDAHLDFARRLTPRNIIQSYIQTERTRPDLLHPIKEGGKRYTTCQKYVEDSESKKHPGLTDFRVIHEYLESPDILGTYTVSVFVGVCAVLVGDSAKTFLNVFVSASEVFLLMATWSLRLAPIGVAASMAGEVLNNASPFLLSSSMIRFVLINHLCQLIQCFLILPFIYWFFTRKSPFKFYLSILPIIATAFATCSSTGSSPMTIKGLENNSRLDPRVVRLLTPVLAIMNANGTMIHCACSICFLLLRYDVPLSFGDEVYTIFATLVTCFTVSSGLPIAGPHSCIPVIINRFHVDPNYAFDIMPAVWIMDPMITTTNVVGDCICSAIVNYVGRKNIRFLREAEEKAIREMQLAEANQHWSQMGKNPQPPTQPTITPTDTKRMEQMPTNV